MAHFLVRSYPTNTSTQLSKETSFTSNSLLRRSKSERVNWVLPNKGFVVKRFSSGSTSTSSAEQVGLVENNEKFDVNDGVKREQDHNQFEYLTSDYGWKVRRLAKIGEEIRNAARVQAEAFHEPSLVFNDFFFQFFQAEVLAGLLYKLRNSPPDRYACLVAEPETSDISNSEQLLVGVVDVTVLRDQNVLQNLPSDADEYLYISGIAVLETFRRKKVGTALLKACDMLSVIWGFKYLVLRAYEDDKGARKLYSNAGYRVVSGDPPWLTTWIGRKRRVLMIKHTNLPSQTES